MRSDIKIAQEAKLLPIYQIAEKLSISEEDLEPYGRYKAKLSLSLVDRLKNQPSGKLILVSAMSPTPAGEGKTTTTVGLGDALRRLGKKAVICLREPSLGPVFGMKGGAAGGGFAQVVPMEDINLHFTGDFGAIQLAHNLLSALIDNHIHHGNDLDIDPRRITWKRVLDMNDRALRKIVVGLGGSANGFTREDSFDIVVASEIMAILCLATSLTDLKERLGNIVIGYTRTQKEIRARDLKAAGAMAVLLREALKPNLVQTLENTPAMIHGGPFANIAHGCNSLIATHTALKLADYVVTEAGFGADLGAEKFIDIKCRKSGLKPDVAVVVATVRALKYHGGMEKKDLAQPDPAAVLAGLPNLKKHLKNLKEHFGLPCVIAINHFDTDTPEEIEAIQNSMKSYKAPVVIAKHWAEGSLGALELAKCVIQTTVAEPSELRFAYPDQLPLLDKIRAVAHKIYGASGVTTEPHVLRQIKLFEERGYSHFPVCIAKTQYSFSNDPNLRGAPEGHTLIIREVRLAAGAEFLVAVCGDVMTMPGLPKSPSAYQMDLMDDGKIVGLF